MVSYLTFYDAAFPPARPPVTDGVCVYLGGDTLHVWTRAEVDAQQARYVLPIFVRSDPRGLASVAPDLNAALAQLEVIGAPRGCLVAVDMETADDKLYIAGMYTGLLARGYQLMVYGSDSTVFGNDVPSGLYFAADWTGAAHMAGGSAMTQWASFAGYDEDEAEASLPLWDRRPPPLAPPQPGPTARPTEEDDMPQGQITAPQGARQPLSWLEGSVSQIVFRADWEGVQQSAPSVTLRLALASGGWQPVTPNITVSGNEVYIIKTPGLVNGCSFTRVDNGAAVVAFHTNAP